MEPVRDLKCRRLEVFSLFAWVAVKIRLHANIPIEEACNMGK